MESEYEIRRKKAASELNWFPKQLTSDLKNLSTYDKVYTGDPSNQ